MASKTGKKSQPSSKPKTEKQPSQLETMQQLEPTNRPQGLTVVGIGASAGGLSALNSIFDYFFHSLAGEHRESIWRPMGFPKSSKTHFEFYCSRW